MTLSATDFLPHTPGAVALVALAALVLAWLVRPDPLRGVPGPPLARWTPLWLAYHARKGKRYLAVHEAHLRYGPAVRIAPNHVSILAPELVYAQGSSALDKSAFYRAFYVGGQESMFSTQDRAAHAAKRRLLSQPFSYQSIRGFEGFMRESVARFVARVDAVCAGQRFGDAVQIQGSTAWMDALLWFNYLAFDVISDLAFGEPLGMVLKGSDLLPAERADGTIYEEHAAALIDQRGRTAAVVGLMPRFENLTKMLPIPFISRGYQSTESLSRIAKRCVKHRLQSGITRDDILERLVDGLRDKKRASGESGEIDEDDVVTEAMLLLTAGADTTANSLTAILFHVLKNHRVYKKLVKELDENVDSAMSHPSGRPAAPARAESAAAIETTVAYLPTHDQVKNLPYLQATIEEGLRMFATNAFGLPRVAGVDGAVWRGHAFPPGTELSAPAYTLQHDPDVWGDPEVFRPERWVEQGAGELKRHMMTFGMGPRACIGKNLAYMQMQLVLATVLLRYEFALRDHEMRSLEGFMHKPVELWVRVRRRSA